MSQDDIVQIKVDKHSVGIMGFNDVMEEMAGRYVDQSDHVRDIKEIGAYGVMGTPALIINGKVMAVGKVPAKAKLKKWLSEYKG